MSHLLNILRVRSAPSPDSPDSSRSSEPESESGAPPDVFESRTWAFGNGSRVTVHKSRAPVRPANVRDTLPPLASRGPLLTELTRQLASALVPPSGRHYSLSGEPAVLWPGSIVSDVTNG